MGLMWQMRARYRGVVLRGLPQSVIGCFLPMLTLLANPSPGSAQPAPTRVQGEEAIGGGLFIAGNYLYVAAWGYGLQVLDISRPTQPKWVGGWNHRGAPMG